MPFLQEASLTSARSFVDYILREKGIELPPLPETCLITYSDGFLRRAKERYFHRAIDIGSRKPTEVYVFTSSGGNFSMISPQYGAAMAVTTLEELIALGDVSSRMHGIGFANFLSLGTTGHPTNREKPELDVGDVLLVSRALRYEGASHHYADSAHMPEADETTQGVLKQILSERGIHFREGTVATTDAIYRETPSFISAVLDADALGIDMETSALFTVSGFHDRRCGALLYVSDVVKIQKNGWGIEFLSGPVEQTEEKLFDVAVDFARRIKNAHHGGTLESVLV